MTSKIIRKNSLSRFADHCKISFMTLCLITMIVSCSKKSSTNKPNSQTTSTSNGINKNNSQDQDQSQNQNLANGSSEINVDSLNLKEFLSCKIFEDEFFKSIKLVSKNLSPAVFLPDIQKTHIFVSHYTEEVGKKNCKITETLKVKLVKSTAVKNGLVKIESISSISSCDPKSQEAEVTTDAYLYDQNLKKEMLDFFDLNYTQQQTLKTLQKKSSTDCLFKLNTASLKIHQIVVKDKKVHEKHYDFSKITHSDEFFMKVARDGYTYTTEKLQLTDEDLEIPVNDCRGKIHGDFKQCNRTSQKLINHISVNDAD